MRDIEAHGLCEKEIKTGEGAIRQIDVGISNIRVNNNPWTDSRRDFLRTFQGLSMRTQDHQRREQSSMTGTIVNRDLFTDL